MTPIHALKVQHPTHSLGTCPRPHPAGCLLGTCMYIHAVQVSPSSVGNRKRSGMREGGGWSSISENTLVRFGQLTLQYKATDPRVTAWKRMAYKPAAWRQRCAEVLGSGAATPT